MLDFQGCEASAQCTVSSIHSFYQRHSLAHFLPCSYQTRTQLLGSQVLQKTEEQIKNGWSVSPETIGENLTPQTAVWPSTPPGFHIQNHSNRLSNFVHDLFPLTATLTFATCCSTVLQHIDKGEAILQRDGHWICQYAEIKEVTPYLVQIWQMISDYPVLAFFFPHDVTVNHTETWCFILNGSHLQLCHLGTDFLIQPPDTSISTA